MKIKLAIVGSREGGDWSRLEQAISSLPYDITAIISGGAKGVDRMARMYSILHTIPLFEYLPNWNEDGKSAGMIRNKKIIDKADYVIIMWNGYSQGTQNDIELCKQLKKPYYLIDLSKTATKIYNIGYADIPCAKAEKGWKSWVGMLKRLTTRKEYSDVKIDPSWLYFSQYQRWYLQNKFLDWHMDKDLSKERIYGPLTCTYLPSEINEQLQRKTGYEQVEGSFIPVIYKNGKAIKGSKWTTAEGSREEYIKMKKEYMKELVDKYSLWLDQNIQTKLLNYYE